MFVHLHVHNEYSFLDGLGKARDYLQRAKDLGQTFLALTNHANIDGFLDFQREAEKIGISPIFGCELYVVPDMSYKNKGEERYHLTVLIESNEGFENLCKMLTKANLRGFYYKPRVDFRLLLKYCQGLIFLTGCSSSLLLSDKHKSFIFELQKKIPGKVYLEVMPHSFDKQKELNVICFQISREYGWPLVATNDCHYIWQEDNILQEILLAIQTKSTWEDPDRFRFQVDSLYLTSEEEMKKAFLEQNILTRAECLIAMRQTEEIALQCKNFRIESKPVFLPAVVEDGEEEYLRSLCLESYQSLFGVPLSGKYLNRFEEEFDLIKKKGFIGYFLVVKELVDWCCDNDIMIGPGRGSIGGSLIAYLIGIIAIDPIKYDLLFSRFISDDRIDYPDIDIDFEDRKRYLVREHLEERYGKNNVASVSTFLRMKGRMAIRDVSRVFNVPYKSVDEFAKVIFDEGGENSIDSALKETVEGKRFGNLYPQVVHWASRLEGQVRGGSQNAAALIVSSEDLTCGTRGNLVLRSNQEVINWGKDDAEFMGLLKLDVLGLNTLSVLSETRRLVKQNYQKDLVFEHISLDNKQIFEMLSRGETVGVFQFNTWPTTKLCKRVGVDSFEMMGNVIALIRPGPSESGMLEEFLKRKHGAKWKKKHPFYEEVTKNTFGIIVYQEQIMEVIYKVAGLPYSVADKIRRIISKKRDVDEFEQYRQMFLDGCKKQGTLDKNEVDEFWLMLEKYARYGFSKSHSIGYAMIAYYCAFCKLFYPAEFICANLSYGSEGKKEELVEEARRFGLNVILPRFGISDAFQWVVKENNIYVPFIEIRGVGEKTAKELANYSQVNRSEGFFDLGQSTRLSKRIETILREIGAMGRAPVEDLQKYFSFKIFRQNQVKKLDRYIPGIFSVKKYCCEEVLYCKGCELRSEAVKPVLSSRGIYNIPIIGEAPGAEEDKQGRGFVGKAGDLLWKELWKYGFTRRQFHVTNVCKCFVDPKREHILACSKWLDDEIRQLDAKICLALGNTPVKYFRGEDGGIVKLCGITEWNEQKQIWVCWGIHPAAVLYNPNNKLLFEEGIKNFADKIQLLGGLQ